MRLVERGGLEALTIHRLAAELDCAVGGIYRYFPSMSALYGELQRGIVREYDAELSAELSLHESQGPIAALASTALHYHRWFSARPGKLGLVSFGMADPRHILSDDDNQLLAAEAGRVVARLVELLERGAAEERLDRGDPIRRAFAFWSAVHGVFNFRKLARLGPALPENEELLVEVAGALFVGWGADRAGVARAFRRAKRRS